MKNSITKNYLKLFICLQLVTVLASCKRNLESDPKPDKPQPPVPFLSLVPGEAPYGTEIVISGIKFSPLVSEDKVLINGMVAEVKSADSTALHVIVPIGAGTGPVTVTVKGETFEGTVFTYDYTAVVSTLAGSVTAGAQNGTGKAAGFNMPSGVTVDAAGNIYVADKMNNQIRKISPQGTVTTLAGSGKKGAGDGTGLAADFNEPNSLAVDSAGNIYVADTGNNLIRKITPEGVVTTLAGNGAPTFNNPLDVAADRQGNVYVADSGNNMIKRVSPDGLINILDIINNPGYLSFSGNATGGELRVGNNNQVNGVFFSQTAAPQNIFLAGSELSGYVDGFNTDARFSGVSGVVIGNWSDTYVVDSGNNRIRQIYFAGGWEFVKTIAGSVRGYIDGASADAAFNNPRGMAMDASGSLYVADSGNNMIRKIIFR